MRHVPSSAFLLLLLLLSSVHFRHCPLPVQNVFLRVFCPFFPIPSPVCLNLSVPPSQMFTSAVLAASGTPNVQKSSSLYAFLLRRRRMAADVSGTKSRENSANAKHRKASEEEAKYCPKEWASLSQTQQNGRKSGEKRRPTKAFTEMPSMPKTFTSSPPIRTTSRTTSWTGTTLAVKKKHWSSSTVKMVAEDRRHRSASASVEKSVERHAKLTHRPRSTENIHRPNNFNNKNNGRRGGGTATKPHHKRGRGGGGGKTPSNWRVELSSAEQSIALMLRCQELDTRELLPSATTCRNLRSDKVCNYLFQEIETKTGQRDVKCNLQGLEDIAESCRKTCGICCEDINYACEDDQNGIVDCSRQLDKCHQKKWFGVLSRFCAGSCGLCAMSTCRDYDNSCRVRKALCLKPEALDYMRENCGRTCGFCVIGESSAPIGAGEGAGGKGASQKRGGTANAKGNSGKPVVVGRPEGPPKGKHRLVVPECTDKVDNCTANVHLCNSPHLGEYMIKFCTKTCLKCGEAQTTKTNGKSAPEPPPIEVIIEPMMETSNNRNNENARSPASNSNNRRTMTTTNKCVDREERCIQWRTEGLCNNSTTNGTTTATKFNGGQRRACAKTCGDCK